VSVVSVCDQAPVNGAIPDAVNGSRFTVHVSFARGATTAAKVKELRLYFDSNQTPAATVSLSPPQAGGTRKLYCSNLAEGSHTLKVVAVDNGDHTTDSATVSVTIAYPAAQGQIVSLGSLVRSGSSPQRRSDGNHHQAGGRRTHPPGMTADGAG
jgi:hypothetical protein